MIHHVKLDEFDGPIELLIYLIRQQEIDIARIPIARITDQYLSYLQTLNSLNIENAAEFLLLAVVLIRLKVRSLLPRMQAEDLGIGTTVSLDEIAAEFQSYREAARILSEREEKQRGLFPRAGASQVVQDTRGDVMLLTTAFRAIIDKLAPKEDWVVERVQLKIDERLGELRARLDENRVVDFMAYLEGLDSLAEVIITFLAALELARLGEIRVSQDEVSGRLILYRRVTLVETAPSAI
jgi:segregation and condensation protein A